VGDAPFRSLRLRGDDGWKLNEEFRLYYGRLIHRIHRDEFDDWLRQSRGAAFILARPSPETTEFLSARGFQLIDHAQVDKNDLQELWRGPAS
jgi:hypothetical protein